MRRRFLLLSLAAALVALTNASFAGTSTTRPAVPAVQSPVVTRDWLSPLISTASIIVVDTRPAPDYARGHIPSAINFDITQTQIVTADKAQHVASAEQVCQALGAAGIDPAATLVIYDAGEDYRRAAYLFMVLQAHGFPSAAVLDGGYDGWIAAGSANSTTPTCLNPAEFRAARCADHLVDKARVLRAIHDPGCLIVDARTPEEFRGLKSSTRRAGHIPGAVNFSSATNFDHIPGVGGLGCQFKSPDDLLEQYFAVPPDKKVIVYCNSGHKAAVDYLALRLLGRDAMIYDGSWLEWGSDPALPIETEATAELH